jgi:hypothetical protein
MCPGASRNWQSGENVEYLFFNNCSLVSFSLMVFWRKLSSSWYGSAGSRYLFYKCSPLLFTNRHSALALRWTGQECASCCGLQTASELSGWLPTSLGGSLSCCLKASPGSVLHIKEDDIPSHWHFTSVSSVGINMARRCQNICFPQSPGTCQ